MIPTTRAHPPPRTPSKWWEREVIRLTWLVLVGPLTCALWFMLGLVSIRRLGRVLERTGRNLQDYDW